MNIQRKNSAHHFRMQSEREQTLDGVIQNYAAQNMRQKQITEYFKK